MDSPATLAVDYNYHSNPRIPTDIELSQEAMYRTSVSYINNTHVPIYIREKNDFIIELLPENKVVNCDLKIIITLEFNHLMIPKLNKFFSSLTNTELEQDICLRIMKKQFLDTVAQQNNFLRNKLSLSLIYDIPYSGLTKFSNSVYVPDIDILIHIGDGNIIPRHPYSLQSQMNQYTNHEVTELENNSFRFAIDIIDNNDKLSPKYLSIAGSIAKITPRKDKNLLDGIYVLNTAVSDEVTYYSYAHFTDLGLFNTEEEATSKGNIELANKVKLKKLESDLEESKMSFTQMKLKQESEIAKLTHQYNLQIQAAKDSQSKAEAELTKIKNQYDYNTYVRKDAQDNAKQIPTIILGVITLTLAISKFFGK